jgi:dipeptidyl aminopeptidase/acylaminoacyl peptidase
MGIKGGIMKKIKIAVVLIAFVFCLSILAGNSKRPLTPEDIVNMNYLGGPQISPDGKWVAYVMFEPLKSKKRFNADIWIAPAAGKSQPRKYALSPASEVSPIWSPDGKFLAFLSNRGKDKKMQIFLLAAAGGEAHALTGIKGGVRAFKWRGDSKCIAFTSGDAPTEEEEKKKKENDADVPDEILRYQRLYEIDLTSKKVRRINKKDENVNDFDYSPDGKRFAVLVSRPYIDETYYMSQLVVINSDGTGRKVIDKNGRTMVRWSPDGKKLLYFAPAGKYGKTNLPSVFSFGTGQSKLLLQKYRGHVMRSMEWLPDNRSVLFFGYSGVEGIIGVFDIETEKVKKLKDCYSRISQFSTDKKGKWIAFIKAGIKAPEDIYIMDRNGQKERQLTKVNPRFEQISFGDQEAVQWQSKDGTRIEGVLVKPVNYKPGQRYPLVAQIHGGPEWVWCKGWYGDPHEWAPLLSNRGFAVLLPNIRGSQGYGVEFIEKNYEDLGGADFEDIMSGIDYLIEKGIADPERLGISGWSYGGFMTARAVTRTTRFKAAVDGAGIVNYGSQYRTTDNDIMWDYYFQGNPYNKKEAYDRRAPISHVLNVKTPTLILHGKEDRRVPVSQGIEFYHALKKLGVTTKCVLYPRAGHGINEQAHQIDLMNRMLDWFITYLTPHMRGESLPGRIGTQTGI